MRGVPRYEATWEGNARSRRLRPRHGRPAAAQAVQKFIEDPLSEEILFGRFEAGDTVLVELDKNCQILFRKATGTNGGAKEEEEQIVKN